MHPETEQRLPIYDGMCYIQVRCNGDRHGQDTDADIHALLPLAPAFFHILIALGDGERHGYSIMQEVAERTDGRVRMSPGTLYGSIKRMLEEGLIEELTTGAAGGR